MDLSGAANISDTVLISEDAVRFDGCAINEVAVGEAKEDVSDSQDGFEMGNDWEIDFSEHDIIIVMTCRLF